MVQVIREGGVSEAAVTLGRYFDRRAEITPKVGARIHLCDYWHLPE